MKDCNAETLRKVIEKAFENANKASESYAKRVLVPIIDQEDIYPYFLTEEVIGRTAFLATISQALNKKAQEYDNNNQG